MFTYTHKNTDRGWLNDQGFIVTAQTSPEFVCKELAYPARISKVTPKSVTSLTDHNALKLNLQAIPGPISIYDHPSPCSHYSLIQ